MVNTCKLSPLATQMNGGPQTLNFPVYIVVLNSNNVNNLVSFYVLKFVLQLFILSVCLSSSSAFWQYYEVTCL